MSAKLPSDAERVLETRLAQLGQDLPPAVREYLFASPRRWRFDFCWPDRRLAVEVDGGTWSPGDGRHNTDADRRKLNAAAAAGWRILRFSPGMLDRDPVGCIETIRAAVAAATGETLR